MSVIPFPSDLDSRAWRRLAEESPWASRALVFLLLDELAAKENFLREEFGIKTSSVYSFSEIFPILSPDF